MKTAGRVDVFASLARASCGTVSAAAVEIPLPGEPAVKAALEPAPFPDRMSAYVWRNWFCVPRSRLASVVGAERVYHGDPPQLASSRRISARS
jgi:hypothetical protein